MQAIILAAGMGRRLGEWTKDNTKCMLPVNGIRLIDRVLNQLSKYDLKKVLIVVGYKGQNVIDYIGDRYDKILNIEYAFNPIYDKTNNIYSLSLVKEQMKEDDTILIESDLIVDDKMFDLILDDPYPNLALVAKYETWMDGTMVRIDKDNNILNFIPKAAFKYSEIDSYYKTVNIYKFSKEFVSERYMPFLEAYLKTLGANEYYESVLRVITLLNIAEVKAKPVGSLPWYEIDDIQDKDIAETIFSPDKDKLKMYMKRYGGYWRFENLLDFCYLVNPFYPTEKLCDELHANFNRLLTEYPSGMYVNSLLASKHFGVKQDYIVIGNGAAELIKSLMENLDGKIGIVYPTFEEYPHRKKKEEIVPYYVNNKNFSYTAKDLTEFFKDKDIKNLLLINPDNPSGNFIPVTDVLMLTTWCQERNITLIVDESFVDFSEGWQNNSLLKNEILESFNNLVVIKSISKSYGVPGLRLGILSSSNINLINYIKKDVGIWNINSFAEFYMQISDKYIKSYKEACAKFQDVRKDFFLKLSEIPFLRVIPSQANYFLCEVTDKYTSHDLTEILLTKYNILIKDCSTKSGLENSNMIRIAVKTYSDNYKLIDALKNL